MAEISTKPYFLRAIYEWCSDNGYTPHVAVSVDEHTRVPPAHVRNGEIVLNIGLNATRGLKMENDYIFFGARFGGVPMDIVIPVARVSAIYARENGQGMAFEVSEHAPQESTAEAAPARPTLSSVPREEAEPQESSKGEATQTDDEPPRGGGGRPTLTRIK